MSGTTAEKTDPRPGTLCKFTLPPSSSASLLASGSPSPVPLVRRCIGCSACANSSKISLILEGDAYAGVGDGEDDRLPRSIQGCGDAHMPSLCELEGIRDEVAQDLGNLPLVSVEGRDAVGVLEDEGYL